MTRGSGWPPMPDPDTTLAEILNPLVSGYRRGGNLSLVAAVREAGWAPAGPDPELSAWLAAIDVQAEAGPLVPALAAARDEMAAAVHGREALARWRANGEAT